MGLAKYFDRKLIEEFILKPEIKSLSKEDLFKLLDQLFKEEYQGKVVTFKMLESDLFVKTNHVTRENFGFLKSGSSYKGFLTKLRISASGGYVPLISNCEYIESADENKPYQNKFHKNTLKWHYFAKEILCEGQKFRVQIDVRESKRHEFMIYGVSMKQISRVIKKTFNQEKENKKIEPANSAPRSAADSRSAIAPASSVCDNILSQKTADVNKENKKSLINLIAEALSYKKPKNDERSVPGMEREL